MADDDHKIEQGLDNEKPEEPDTDTEGDGDAD